MIGWYVHHSGYGHVSRFLAVLPHLRGPVVAFSSLPRPASAPSALEWVVLPADDDPVALRYAAGNTENLGVELV